MRFVSQTFLAIFLVCGAAATSSAQLVVDLFNRPDNTNLGPNWIEQAGDTEILTNAAVGSNVSLMTYVGQTGTALTADIFFNGTSLQYGALVLGYADLLNNLFVKVQGSGLGFTGVFFYYGNNGSSFGVGTNFTATTFTSARMTLTLVGTTATMSLDTNFDGIADQVFSRTDVPLAFLGTGVGLGFYGAASMDNFTLSAVPEPATAWLLLLGGGVAAVSFRLRRRQQS